MALTSIGVGFCVDFECLKVVEDLKNPNEANKSPRFFLYGFERKTLINK